MKKMYMLDTCICSFIMREQPLHLLQRLHACVDSKNQIVVSAITYAEMQYGVIGKKASPKHAVLVNQFIQRLNAVLPWDKAAVDTTVELKKQLSAAGTPIGVNDSAIAGHALSCGAILITHNLGEFSRVPGLIIQDWTQQKEDS
ncbi:VapC toxin family PIN domain ribonuclease [Candidatus Williamhamiltonella defendens]|nr:type II toxin-antitoxin system VapC family toxin [Candidatus Hamiltonella defensa]ATW21949.1 VapC toxin family PIN domain ribonuclease [Candidatus Hamiltonella defensa]